MRVSKWGEDLAVRLPVAMVQDLQLHEGDEVELVAVDGRTLELRAVEAGAHSIEGEELQTDEAEEAKRRAEAIAGLRALARPFPPDFRFNREEANARWRDVEP